MRFLDGIVRGIALVAHACVIMTLRITKYGLLLRLVSIQSQLSRTTNNGQIHESTDLRSSPCSLSIKAPWLLDPYSNLVGPNPAKSDPRGVPPPLILMGEVRCPLTSQHPHATPSITTCGCQGLPAQFGHSWASIPPRRLSCTTRHMRTVCDPSA